MRKNCANCQKEFVIMEKDIELLQKISPVIQDKKYPLPPPTHCPQCRMQRRFAMRNESKLYRRTCALTGKPMVSLYSEDKPYTVYSESAWASDAWEPMQYGTDIDFSRTFFDQFKNLMLQVPRKGMHQDGTSQNSDYTAFGMSNKNSYLAFSCFLCEDVYYSSWCMSKNSMDCLVCVGCELSYQCIDCSQCYHCFYCRESTNCQDSILLDNCRNCTCCIGCKNLRSKEYHIYNQAVSKEEYEAKRSELLSEGLEVERATFATWANTLPTIHAQITQSEGCTGNYIEQSKHCINCYDLHLGSEDLRHCQLSGWQAKDMMDCISSGKNAEMLYEMHGAGSGTQHCAFVSFSTNCLDVYYSESVKNCSDCFGCVGLTNKKFCILNKQYAKDEYFALIPSIIAHMEKMQEWGEFFPISLSPFCYNETMAQEHFPLTKEEVVSKGWNWKDITGEVLRPVKSIHARDLPISSLAVEDDILEHAIICEVTQKPFKIIQQELDFYRREKLPLPRLHPEERFRRRMAMRTPYQLWQRHCQECEKEIQSSYHPSRPERVVCEACYLQKVY